MTWPFQILIMVAKELVSHGFDDIHNADLCAVRLSVTSWPPLFVQRLCSNVFVAYQFKPHGEIVWPVWWLNCSMEWWCRFGKTAIVGCRTLRSIIDTCPWPPPPSSMSQDIVLSVATSAWLHCLELPFSLILVSFHCLLRAAEAKHLRWCGVQSFVMYPCQRVAKNLASSTSAVWQVMQLSNACFDIVLKLVR